MIFSIKRTSSTAKPHKNSYFEDGIWKIFIGTLGQLVKLSEEDDIIISGNHIEIYDDYRE